MRNPRSCPRTAQCGQDAAARLFHCHRERKYPGHDDGYRRVDLFGAARNGRIRAAHADLAPLRDCGSYTDARGQPLCAGEPARPRRADRSAAQENHAVVHFHIRPAFDRVPAHRKQPYRRTWNQQLQRRRRVPAAARFRYDRLCREFCDADLLRQPYSRQ